MSDTPKLHFDNEWLKRTIESDGENEPTAGNEPTWLEQRTAICAEVRRLQRELAAKIAECEAIQRVAEMYQKEAGELTAEFESLKSALYGIKEYREKNPLGGPAKVFDAMADCVRAGDDFKSVLREYGFVTEGEVEALREDAERWRVCLDAQGVAVSIFNVDPPCWRYPEGVSLIAAIDAIRNGTDGAWCVPIDTWMRCPQCGGIADNGHDRELPPNTYLCTSCTQNEFAGGGETRNQYWRAIDAARKT